MVMMTEEENGRLRPSEERELLMMPVDEFFINLLVFKERMNKRIAESKNRTNKHA